CPGSEYLASLEATYTDLVQRGRLEFLPAVRPDELVEGASFADVGVIPYAVRFGEYEHNYNHLYCCPNKLSQYMQAGLALLCSNSEFLAESVAKYDCGARYDPDRAETLVAAARWLLDDLPALARMKRRARRWARAEFHWDRPALPYRRLIEAYTGIRPAPVPAPAAEPIPEPVHLAA